MGSGFICPYIYDLRNLGDYALNSWLLNKIIPQRYLTFDDPRYLLLGPGSILGYSRRFSRYGRGYEKLPRIVIGSGWQNKDKTLPANSIVVFVRGSFTCEKMGIDRSLACGDGALLARRLMPIRRQDPIYEEGVIKKHNYAGERSERVFTTETDDIESWTKKLFSYKRVSTESLHGAIFADMFRIPWKPLRWKAKWNDHFSQLGILERPRSYILSDEKRLYDLEERQHQLLGKFTASLESIRLRLEPE